MNKNYSNLPKRILKSLLDIEKKIVSYPVEEKYKKMKQKIEDEKENREVVVTDKYGNKYYQYFSHQGLPTRRIVHLNMESFNKWSDDPIMTGWLQRRRLTPPTQEELEKMYIEQEEFTRRGLEWDKKENELLEAFRKKQREALEKERKETKSIGEGKDFQPGIWEKTQLVEVKEQNQQVMEGKSSIPGKYIMDFNKEDQEWMDRREQKMLQPYNEMAALINWDQYDLKHMNLKYYNEVKKLKEDQEEKKKELTNIGKKMLEKKIEFQKYSQFRQRFKDVFKENDFE